MHFWIRLIWVGCIVGAFVHFMNPTSFYGLFGISATAKPAVSEDEKLKAYREEVKRTRAEIERNRQHLLEMDQQYADEYNKEVESFVTKRKDELQRRADTDLLMNKSDGKTIMDVCYERYSTDQKQLQNCIQRLSYR